jgi:hypothetical protein
VQTRLVVAFLGLVALTVLCACGESTESGVRVVGNWKGVLIERHACTDQLAQMEMPAGVLLSVSTWGCQDFPPFNAGLEQGGPCWQARWDDVNGIIARYRLFGEQSDGSEDERKASQYPRPYLAPDPGVYLHLSPPEQVYCLAFTEYEFTKKTVRWGLTHQNRPSGPYTYEVVERGDDYVVINVMEGQRPSNWVVRFGVDPEGRDVITLNEGQQLMRSKT